jgi:hypothetical protein
MSGRTSGIGRSVLQLRGTSLLVLYSGVVSVQCAGFAARSLDWCLCVSKEAVDCRKPPLLWNWHVPFLKMVTLCFNFHIYFL